MAETAVAFLLENVSLLLKHYVDLISNARDEMQSLENDLKLLKAFLQEAATKPKKEEPYRELERQIRQVVYEAEDTIDKCLVLAASESKGRKFLGRFKHNRVSMAQQVRALNTNKVKPMVDRATTDFAKMEIAGGPTGTFDAQPALPATARATPTSQDNIIGLEDEEAKIIGYLTQQTKELDVVSIIGMPGLGKTTLASKIYHNKDMRYEFPVHIWVYVSRAFNRKEVLLTILRKFDQQDMSNLPEQDLAERVRSHLEDAKFLLVLDDIWTIEAWRAIQAVLPKKNFSSKVLVTSRFTNVCQVVNPSREPHTLRFLYPDESWKLLQLQVFGKVGDYPQELETVGILIARECDGLPLAIVVIGGYLLGLKLPNDTINVLKNKWVEVSKNLDQYLLRQDDQGIAISNIVSWSYNSLPIELRECFIYLAVFPENNEIQTWTLMHLWIAEGFVQHKPGQGSLEDTAKENLNSLIARNLVIAGKTNPNGEVKTIRVHDLIRAFCTAKASVTDQNLFQEIKKTNEGVFDPKVKEIRNHRRICIHSNIQDFLSEQPDGPNVRSFLCFNTGSSELETSYNNYIPDAFELLRVLDSKSIKFKKFPSRVTKLVHLRYITVSVDDLNLLPGNVSALWNLQTLVVETKENSLTIEANIWKMMQLRHLKTKASIILTPHKEAAGKGSENSLQTLGRLSPESCSKDVFAKASKLRRLGIRGRLETAFKESCIDKLAYLEKLKLVNDIHCPSKSRDPLSRLPLSDWFPTNLKRLTITSTSLEWDQISTLSTIKKLEILKLKDRAFIGMEWKLYNYCFTSLHFLLIEDTDLMRWDASTHNFPELKTLVLSNCQNLLRIPVGLAEKLEKLEMDNMEKEAVESALMIEEYSKKLKPEQGNEAWGGRFRLSIGPGCKRPTYGRH